MSEYDGLNPLPAATKDVEAMRQVLENPEIGGFDEVTVLVNPEQQKMAESIETLFYGRHRNDLLLLFFSGHGIKDEHGKLYFAARNTSKNKNGVLFKATTVPATFVHDVMKNSRSKREVVILDCCFSGAFGQDMSARDDGLVDIKNQLGGEGRAVLTSSTSTQYAFEQQGADTSTYTHYIVEGLATGAADQNEDGWISVDELHEYATQAVQEATPAMKPEIYAIREGYNIKLAQAPVGDPKLRYTKEVDYWIKLGNGEISGVGRDVLDELKLNLGLTSEETKVIENQVLEPHREYQRKLKRYEERFTIEIQPQYPISDNTRADLKRLQKILGLTDENIALIEAPIIAELTKPPVVVNPQFAPNSNFKNYIQACIIGVIGVVIGGVLVYFIKPKPPVIHSAIRGENFCPQETYNLNDTISLGEEILLVKDTNPDKEAGVKAFLQGDCLTAINKFNSYRQANSTNLRDPEALIYLNNANARQQINRLRIAVSVPIGTNPNVAKEILRGVAQAQDEVNNNGGINGKALEVAIANDNNDPVKASQIANQLVKDSRILAVVGHISSNVSLAAALVYQPGGLVMISPTSISSKLSELGSYIFRTAPSVDSLANKLSHYVIKRAGKTNILICSESTAIDGSSFKEKFVKKITDDGGTINSTNCDISSVNFNAGEVISQAISNGADGLVLAIYMDTKDKGLGVAQANKGRLTLLSTPTLARNNTLQKGKADINGMIVAVPWHLTATANNPFAQNAQRLWRATVNWTTALSYDATLAIIGGLKTSNTRYELQNKLYDSSFSVDGATGKIQFSKSGDRLNNNIFLVKVQKKSGTDEYEFVPIPD